MLQLPPLRPGREPPEDLRARRAALAGARPDLTTATVPTVEQVIAGVPCIVVTPSTADRDLLYFHGGGYRLGAAIAWTAFAARLADALRARVTVPDYRLAPEHPFPAALYDAAAVYEELRAAAAGAVLVGGDSAGGGLAAALTVACVDDDVARPDALLLLSPWLDLTLTGATHVSRAATDQLFPPASSTEAADSYLQGHDATDPLASAAFADVARFPPVFLTAGTEETLLSDAVGFAQRLAEARIGVTLHVGAGMQHVWPMIFPDRPESGAAIAALGAFVAGLGPRSH
jgi:monoterpene epsilon-lactone hydrolase